MTTLRVLHVDDEPDIREVVEFSLGLDPGLVVRSCASGMSLPVCDWITMRLDATAHDMGFSC